MSEYAGIMQPPFGTGPNLMPGLAQVLYFASVNDIETFGTPEANPANAVDKYVIKTPHVMKVGKMFHKMYVSIEKGQLKYEKLGGRDATGFNVNATSYMPGDSPEQNYFANEAQGDRFIILAKRADGKLAQVGLEDFPATMHALHDSETVTGDGSGYGVNIQAYMPFKLLYDAAIPLTPAAEE
ncbi:hypothetical protein GCM10027275_24970 [Rhabdobacter roseus]|uniref:Uncharacterized protein n=1 Tax=Rhabdobacter roseus TaxID=1655419 RepID=A0A840TRU8_9BACT|nr:hypothetical protein [Rhabdobacter roseus]MBB5284437.1 hypothetical protein [Rhabdobacter roseus]